MNRYFHCSQPYTKCNTSGYLATQQQAGVAAKRRCYNAGMIIECNRSQVHRSGFKVNNNVQYARGVSA